METASMTTGQAQATPEGTGGGGLWRRGDPRLLALLLLVITLPWWLAVSCPFIHIDDPYYVTYNPQVQAGLNAQTLHWAFTTNLGGFYIPLTWVSYLVDVSLFGGGPKGMHFTNVLLHVANTMLLFWFLQRVTGRAWRSFLVAALFAMHPLRVESVAWVTERKDVLSAFFGLWALLAYAAYARARGGGRGRIGWYAAVFVCMVLSLLAKPMLVTLPALLLLLDWWPLGRLDGGKAWGKLLLEKVPLAVVSLVFSVITVVAQRGALATTDHLSVPWRAGNALLSYLLYLRDTVYFQDLAVFYPQPQVLPVGMVMLAAIVLAGLTWGAVTLWRRGTRKGDGPPARATLVGWAWFVGTLVPVIGLVQSGMQSRADRFTYWPSIGLFIGIIFILPAAWFRLMRGRQLAGALSAAAIAVLAISTTVRIFLWQDPLKLYIDGVNHTDHNGWLKTFVAKELQDRGDTADAETVYKSALVDAPLMYEAHYNFGTLLGRQRRWAEALEQFGQALRLRPDDATIREAYDVTARKLLESQNAPATTQQN